MIVKWTLFVGNKKCLNKSQFIYCLYLRLLYLWFIWIIGVWKFQIFVGFQLLAFQLMEGGWICIITRFYTNFQFLRIMKIAIVGFEELKYDLLKHTLIILSFWKHTWFFSAWTFWFKDLLMYYIIYQWTLISAKYI